MAVELPLMAVPKFVAGEDLTDAQFKFVKIDSGDSVVLCDSTTDIPVGVLQNAPDEGEQCQIMVAGISKVKVGGEGFSEGEEVALRSDATVEEVNTDNDPAAGDTIVGQGYLSGSDGEISSIMFSCLNVSKIQ